jgi:hypothetical protein
MPSFTADGIRVFEGWARSTVEERQGAPDSWRRSKTVMVWSTEMIARIVFASSLEVNEICHSPIPSVNEHINASVPSIQNKSPLA